MKISGNQLKKRITALFAALLITLFAGCGGTGVSSGDPPPYTEPEHSDGSDSSDSLNSESEYSEPNHQPSDSSDISDSSDVPTDPDDPANSNNPDISDNPPDSSEPGSSEEPSSSETPSNPASTPDHGSSSSTPPTTPDPPPVVIIPDVIVPTSPGINTAAAQGGMVDYSNAAQGYISARYTGGKKKAKLIIAANGESYNHDIDPNGATEYFPLSMGSGTYTATLCELIDGTSYGIVLKQQFEVKLDSALSPFLYPNRYVDYSQNSAVVKKAAEICAGKTKTIDKIAAVFVWITDNVTYDYELAATVRTGYVPDPDKTLSKKTGICYDYSSLFAAMLRSQSIPTRLVIGFATPNDTSHAWNEVYTTQTGWITPELLLKNNGYNLVDATFYAGSNNKTQISAYISDTSNYTSVKYY